MCLHAEIPVLVNVYFPLLNVRFVVEFAVQRPVDRGLPVNRKNVKCFNKATQNHSV